MNPPAQSCPACESADVALRLGGDAEGFHLIKCAACGLVSTTPMPDPERLHRYYQGFRFEQPARAQWQESLRAVEQSLAVLCGDSPPQRLRFLDYGGGSGLYAAAAARLGFTATLFDVDEASLAFARQELRLPHICNEFEQLHPPYDVVFAFHVIEHSRDLAGDFAKLVSLLAPNGRLILATPNCASFEKYCFPPLTVAYLRRLRRLGLSTLASLWRVLQPDSILCWDPPRHLYALSAASLNALARRHGLQGRTFCPYNTDPRYEPRQYVLPRRKSFSAWRKGRAPGRGPLADGLLWLARNTSVRLLRGGLGLLALLFPNRGGQLYGVFTKPLTTDIARV